jgi:cytochrome c-type biogenesis protein CcmF
VQYKPLIRLIWLGALFMALGAAVSATDRRYRARSKVSAAVMTGHAAGEAAR